MEYKTYKTVDEQIEYLKENKKIIVDEEDKPWLDDVNYISFINPYKEFFASGHILIDDVESQTKKKKIHIYKNETNFKSFVNMHILEVASTFMCKSYILSRFN